MFETVDKERIVAALKAKLEELNISQAEAARRIGVSAATITNLLGGKWDKITRVWGQVASWVAGRVDSWQAAEIANYRIIQDICRDAQEAGLSRAVSFRPGSGKTFAAKAYADQNPNVFYVGAVGDMSKRQLLSSLCSSMGIGSSYRSAEMLEDIIDKLSKTSKALIIVDEFDELDNKAMRVFKDLYNSLDCGFVLIGGKHLKERIEKGVRRNKQSYAEIYSRIGGEFISLAEVTLAVVRKICVSNGVFDQNLIKDIYAQANGDLRRVKALVRTLQTTSNN